MCAARVKLKRWRVLSCATVVLLLLFASLQVLAAVGVGAAPRVQAGVDGFGRALATELGVAQFRGTARVAGTLQDEKTAI